jgi:hypothetical protein
VTIVWTVGISKLRQCVVAGAADVILWIVEIVRSRHEVRVPPHTVSCVDAPFRAECVP